MLGRPQPNEAASYYSKYIERVSSDDIVAVLATQLEETIDLLSDISEEQSLYRYASDKWSMRELLGHVSDTERVFTFRALWFARGFQDPLPSYEQEVAVAAAESDKVSWASHIDEFRAIRSATVAFFLLFWQRSLHSQAAIGPRDCPTKTPRPTPTWFLLFTSAWRRYRSAMMCMLKATSRRRRNWCLASLLLGPTG